MLSADYTDDTKWDYYYHVTQNFCGEILTKLTKMSHQNQVKNQNNQVVTADIKLVLE